MADYLLQDRGVSGPAQPPRSFFPDPSLFGRRPLPRDLGSAPLDAASRGRWTAAQLHWNVAFAVRTALQSTRRTKSELADSIGWRRERLSRLLTGHARMSTEDLFLLLDAVGLDWMALAAELPQPPAARFRHRVKTIQWYLKQQLDVTEKELRKLPTAGSVPSTGVRPVPR